ncbi:MAG: DUF1080 domain-containing protein [Prevotellaceae bacterium]|nr:DUF1080 domain-containing protein [Prevotellaceae bacterium]
MNKKFGEIKITVSSIFTVIAFCFIIEVQAQKVEKLFNGKNLSGWNFVIDKNVEPANEVFTVADSVICVKGTLGYMYTKKKYGNTVVHVEWRWADEPTNSGIFILIEDPKNPFPKGIECQLAAGQAGDLVLLGGSDLQNYKAPPEGRPAFPKILKENPSSEKTAGEWNHANIFIKDGVIDVYVNGIHQNHGTTAVKSGHIGLQSEGKKIQFKNITVTPL